MTPPADGRPERWAEAGAALCRVWAQVLDVDQVALDDDFFDLGGDSVLVLQMLARAREVGVDLALDRLGEFLEQPTGLRLLELTQAVPASVVAAPAGEPAPEAPDVASIGLGGDGDEAMVFLLLPSLGDAWAAHELRRQVEPTSIQVLAPTWSPSRPYGSVPALGRSMAARMAAMQPSGPFRIVGSCAAGLAAVEAAGCLLGAGRSVDLLALVNTDVPGRRSVPTPLHHLLPCDPPSRADHPRLIAKLVWLDAVRKSSELSEAGLMLHLWTVVSDHIEELLRYLVDVEPDGWDDAVRDYAARVFMAALNNAIASEAYRNPPRYPGRMRFVYSREFGENCGDPPETALAWSRLTGCTHDLEVLDELHSSAVVAHPAVARLIRESVTPARRRARVGP